jgi:peptide/nickel transport system substrate-binding protein
VRLAGVSVAALMALGACSSVGSDNSSSSSSAPASSASGGGASSASESSGSSAPASSSSSGGATADTITIGLEQAPGGYNGQTAAANSVYGAYVDNATQYDFVNVQPDGTLQPNTEFGSYEKVSDDPLTVKYTFAEGAKWSDGVPLDFDDVLLAWASHAGVYTTGEKDDAGNDVGLFSVASTNGWNLVEKPQGKAGDTSFTLVYKEPYADWEALFTGAVFMPAHIAEEQGGMSSDGNGEALVTAVQNDDTAALTPVATFWNDGWTYQEGLPSIPDVALQPSIGPYKVDNGSNGTLTLVANDQWWGTPAKTPRLVFVVVNPEEWVQAMANGEIDAYEPSNPSQDVVAQLDNLGDAVDYEVGESLSFSHLDFDSSPEGRLADPKVRQALLKCLPRQELVDKFAKPVFPDAQVLNLREFLPAQAGYQDVLSQVPSAAQYEQTDIAAAKQLLTEAGVTQPYDIRIVRSGQSDLRGQQVSVMKASCDQAGFNIIDQPDPDIFTTITTRGTWDAALFGWSSSGLVASGESIYVTGGDQNYGGYSDPIVDQAWADVVRTLDRDEAEKKKIPLEEQLWANPYNAVLYATPGLMATVSSIDGAGFNATQFGQTWNVATWTKSG